MGGAYGIIVDFQGAGHIFSGRVPAGVFDKLYLHGRGGKYVSASDRGLRSNSGVRGDLQLQDLEKIGTGVRIYLKISNTTIASVMVE